MFVVVLEVHYRGACVGSTEDVIEAVDAEAAEAIAIEQWSKARPGFTFAALVTVTRST
jgi:hypothetical protein